MSKVLFITEGPTYNISNYEARLLQVLSRDHGGELWTFGPRAIDTTVGAFRVRCFKQPERFKRLLFLPYLLQLAWHALRLKRARQAPDVVWTYDPFRSGIAGLVVSCLCGARLTVEVNGSYGDPENLEDMPDGWLKTLKFRSMLWVGSRILRRANAIKLLYRGQLAGFDLGPKAGPVFVYPCLVLTDKVQPMAEENFVLFVGFPFLRKGVDVLYRAFLRVADRFPDWRLTLIGHELEAELAKRGMSHPRVQVFKPMSHDKVVGWIGRAAVFVLPSRSEGMGRVLVEAAAAGKPRIGSNVGGIPTVIRHEEDGLLVERGNEEQLAVALERLMSNPELRKRLGEQAARRTVIEFSEERFLENTGSLVASLGRH